MKKQCVKGCFYRFIRLCLVPLCLFYAMSCAQGSGYQPEAQNPRGTEAEKKESTGEGPQKSETSDKKDNPSGIKEGSTKNGTQKREAPDEEDNPSGPKEGSAGVQEVQGTNTSALKIPSIILSEVQSRYDGNLRHSEFIELYALSEGNLSGLNISIAASNKKRKVFTLPQAEVRKGEYVLLHMRNSGTGCISETGSNLDEASSDRAVQGVRDIWLENGNASFSEGSNTVLLYEDDTIIDALIFGKNPDAKKPHADFEADKKKAQDAGIWPSDDMVLSHGVSTTRSLSRKNINEIAQSASYDGSSMNGADHWIVVKTSKSTPGKPNSDEPYRVRTGTENPVK